jgi:hypothetical protein
VAYADIGSMSQEIDEEKLRARRQIALWVLFVFGIIVDFGIGISEAMCENCGGPPSAGQKWTFGILGAIACVVSVGFAWRRLKGASTIFAMISALIWLHWLMVISR